MIADLTVWHVTPPIQKEYEPIWNAGVDELLRQIFKILGEVDESDSGNGGSGYDNWEELEGEGYCEGRQRGLHLNTRIFTPFYELTH